MLSCKL